MDVRHVLREVRRPAGEQRRARQDERHTRRGHVEKREEAAEEHDRAAEVADEDEHQHRQRPDHEHRAEVLQRQSRQPPPHEHVARLREVAREEDDDRELRELGGLELDRPDADAQVRAVRHPPDARKARCHQQGDPDRGDRVAVSLQAAQVAQKNDRGTEERQADPKPRGLSERAVRRDAVDLDEPERREQGAQREHVRIRVR